MGMNAFCQLGGVLINVDGVDIGAANCAVAVHSSKDSEVGKEKEEMAIEIRISEQGSMEELELWNCMGKIAHQSWETEWHVMKVLSRA